MSDVHFPEARLAELERAVTQALESGDTSALEILGYGEISSVLACNVDGNDFACKRLPSFRDSAEWERYRSCFFEYLAALENKGVRPLESRLETVKRPDGALQVWCVQPRLDAAGLVSKHLHRASEGEASELFERVADSILACVEPKLGLDGQLSNWILDDDELRYLDVTTPMLRDASGAERMPIGVFLASLPWALRPAVRRFMLREILDKYYDPRGVLLDLLGNLYKEKLSALLPRFIERANRRVEPAITADEVRSYYASDARSWALLQRLRHADRWWQRHVRRRVYPFLLPGEIER